MLAFELRQAIEAAPLDRLSDLSGALWKGFAAGVMTEAEPLDRLPHPPGRFGKGFAAGGMGEAGAEELSHLMGAGRAAPAAPAAARRRVGSRPRRDASMERRRRWAAAGRLPPQIAQKF